MAKKKGKKGGSGGGDEGKKKAVKKPPKEPVVITFPEHVPYKGCFENESLRPTCLDSIMARVGDKEFLRRGQQPHRNDSSVNARFMTGLFMPLVDVEAVGAVLQPVDLEAILLAEDKVKDKALSILEASARNDNSADSRVGGGLWKQLRLSPDGNVYKPADHMSPLKPKIKKTSSSSRGLGQDDEDSMTVTLPPLIRGLGSSSSGAGGNGASNSKSSNASVSSAAHSLPLETVERYFGPNARTDLFNQYKAMAQQANSFAADATLCLMSNYKEKEDKFWVPVAVAREVYAQSQGATVNGSITTARASGEESRPVSPGSLESLNDSSQQWLDEPAHWSEDLANFKNNLDIIDRKLLEGHARQYFGQGKASLAADNTRRSVSFVKNHGLYGNTQSLAGISPELAAALDISGPVAAMDGENMDEGSVSTRHSVMRQHLNSLGLNQTSFVGTSYSGAGAGASSQGVHALALAALRNRSVQASAVLAGEAFGPGGVDAEPSQLTMDAMSNLGGPLPLRQASNLSVDNGASARSPRSAYLASCIDQQVAPLPKVVLRKTLSTSMDLSHYRMGDQHGSALSQSVSSLPTIEYLSLRDNNLDKAVQPILTSLQKAREVVELDLSVNRVDTAAAEALGLLLSDQLCKIERLVLGECSIDDEICAGLVSSLKQNRTLTNLDLRGNRIGSHEALNGAMTGAAAIAKFLTVRECRLKCLSLAWNQVKLASAQTFALSIASNSTLTALDLSCNPLGSAAETLGASLLDNQTLKTLLLRSCNISSTGCISLVAGATQCLSLTQLSLDDNPIGLAGARALISLPILLGPSRAPLTLSASKCTTNSNPDTNPNSKVADKGFDPTNALAGWIGPKPVVVLPEATTPAAAAAAAAPAGKPAKGAKPGKEEPPPPPAAPAAPPVKPQQPKGEYKLDLSLPYHLCVAFALLEVINASSSVAIQKATYQPLLEGKVKGFGREERLELQQTLSAIDDDDLTAAQVDELRALRDQEASASDVLRATTLFHETQMGGELSREQLASVFDQLGLEGFSKPVPLSDLLTLTDLDGSGTSLQSLLILLQSLKADAEARIKAITTLSFIAAITRPSFPYTPPRSGQLTFILSQSYQPKAAYNVLTTTSLRAAVAIAKQLDVTLVGDAIKLTRLHTPESFELFRAVFKETGQLAPSLCPLLTQAATPAEARRLLSLVTGTIAVTGDSEGALGQIKSAMGSFWRVLQGNVNGYYLLDLAVAHHRACFARLMALSVEMNAQRRARYKALCGDSSLGDTSQLGNWTCFRNAVLNLAPTVVTEKSFAVIPSRGILEFDFVALPAFQGEGAAGRAALSDEQFLRILARMYLIRGGKVSPHNTLLSSPVALAPKPNEIYQQELGQALQTLEDWGRECKYVSSPATASNADADVDTLDKLIASRRADGFLSAHEPDHYRAKDTHHAREKVYAALLQRKNQVRTALALEAKGAKFFGKVRQEASDHGWDGSGSDSASGFHLSVGERDLDFTSGNHTGKGRSVYANVGTPARIHEETTREGMDSPDVTAESGTEPELGATLDPPLDTVFLDALRFLVISPYSDVNPHASSHQAHELRRKIALIGQLQQLHELVELNPDSYNNRTDQQSFGGLSAPGTANSNASGAGGLARSNSIVSIVGQLSAASSVGSPGGNNTPTRRSTIATTPATPTAASAATRNSSSRKSIIKPVMSPAAMVALAAARAAGMRERRDQVDRYRAARYVEVIEEVLANTRLRSRQLALLLLLLPGGQMNRTEAFGSYAAELCVALFAKLADVHNFELVLRVLSARDAGIVLARLGLLSVFNACKPEGSMRLSLNVREERRVLKTLLFLASVEGKTSLELRYQPAEDVASEELEHQQHEQEHQLQAGEGDDHHGGDEHGHENEQHGSDEQQEHAADNGAQADDGSSTKPVSVAATGTSEQHPPHEHVSLDDGPFFPIPAAWRTEKGLPKGGIVSLSFCSGVGSESESRAAGQGQVSAKDKGKGPPLSSESSPNRLLRRALLHNSCVDEKVVDVDDEDEPELRERLARCGRGATDSVGGSKFLQTSVPGWREFVLS